MSSPDPVMVAARLREYVALEEAEAEAVHIRRARSWDEALMQRLAALDDRVNELFTALTRRVFPAFVEYHAIPQPPEWCRAPAARLVSERPLAVPAKVQTVLLISCGSCGRKHWAPRLGFERTRKRYRCSRCRTLNYLPPRVP